MKRKYPFESAPLYIDPYIEDENGDFVYENHDPNEPFFAYVEGLAERPKITKQQIEYIRASFNYICFGMECDEVKNVPIQQQMNYLEELYEDYCEAEHAMNLVYKFIARERDGAVNPLYADSHPFPLIYGSRSYWDYYRIVEAGDKLYISKPENISARAHYFTHVFWTQWRQHKELWDTIDEVRKILSPTW